MTYEVSSDAQRFDRDRFHTWISGHSYWARGRTRDVTERACDASLLWGAFAGGGEMVGAARVVSDGVTFAWLCDVFVDEAHRGRGIGRMLIEAVTEDRRLLDVKRLVLATLDAHDLYRSHGFSEIRRPELWMIREGSTI
jgi:GNAT superfamily N-acetyltransferase